MFRSIVLVLAITSSSLVHAAPTALALPEYIGVLEFMGERTPKSAEVAHAYSYRAVGLSLDIDVYDQPDSAALAQRYEQAKAEARSATVERHGTLVTEKVVQFGSQAAFAAREAVFQLQNPDFRYTAYVWVGGMQGQLLEMRFSVQEGFEEDGLVSRSEIFTALGDAVALSNSSATKNSLAATAPAEPRMKVAIVWDPGTPEPERRLWMTYLMARAAQAARASETEAPVPGEHRASFEEEVRARIMAVHTFRAAAGASDAAPASAYFSDLDRVEHAGFLREYVWRYLHQTSWAATPANLDLRAFEEWRASHLVNHVAVTHGHIAFRLAAK